MAITVRTGSVLKGLLGGKLETQAEGNTVREILDKINALERLCDSSGKIRRHFNIYVNEGEDIRLLQGLDTPVSDNDIVTVLSAIAGGDEISRKIWLSFPKELIEKPLIWKIGQEFKIVTNIRQASVSKDIGLVGLEISGEEEEVKKAVSYLAENGVSVEPIELDIVE